MNDIHVRKAALDVLEALDEAIGHAAGEVAQSHMDASDPVRIDQWRDVLLGEVVKYLTQDTTAQPGVQAHQLTWTHSYHWFDADIAADRRDKIVLIDRRKA